MKVLIIGRDAACDIVINDPKVSRNHCQLVLKDDGTFLIVDLGSSNGTYVNGQRISGEVRLSSLDSVRIGDTVLPLQQYVDFNPSVQRAQEPVQDPMHGKKKSWIWVAAGLVSILLVGGGVVLFRPHEKKIDGGEPEPDDKDRIENLLQLRIKADSLTKAALFAKTEEDRKRLQEEASKIEKLLEEKDSLLHKTNVLAEDKKKLEDEKTDLTAKNGQQQQEIQQLSQENGQLKDETKDLRDANANLAVEAELTKEFMSLWNSLDEYKKDIERDVYIQYTSQPYPKTSGKDLVTEEFLKADNSGKKKMMEIIRITGEFYPEWNKLRDSGANKVFERMGWTKQSNPKMQVKNRFNAGKMDDKRVIVNTIKDVLSNNKDNADTNESEIDVESDKVGKTENTVIGAETVDE